MFISSSEVCDNTGFVGDAMWPAIVALLRSNAVYITLPVAAVIGFVGYNLENILSDKYTPYTSKLEL
uniref:Uncharacterized protein n=1 Tax=Lutzomyia longipalpis TaxID=7200 RepID=A0A1B0CBX6_LUTLO